MSDRGLLIGLTGVALSGKDSLADCLSKMFGYVKLGFSDALWNLALTLNPWLRVYGIFPVKLSWLASRYSYTKCKEFPAVRKYLQWLGTDAIRNHLGQDAWINALRPRVEAIRNEGRHVVITNVRFQNEGEFVLDSDGTVVLVERPGKGPVNNHISDAGLAFPMAEFRIVNDHTLRELAACAEQLHAAIMEREINRQLVQQQPPTLRVYYGESPDVHNSPIG